MKRILSILLCLSMLLTGLLSAVSCGESDENNPAASDAVTQAATEGETVDMAYTDELPELNFGDRTVSIYAAGQVGAKDELYSEGLNNELINDAVYERNQVVEKRLGVKLSVRADGGNDSFDVATAIHNLVLTGTDEYQLCTVPSYVAVQYATKGDYLDLPEVENIDLSKYYWSQGYNDMASWGDGHQFLASGSAALTMFRYMYVTLYNKDIMTDRQMDDPFNAVQNGTWTIEYQTALTEGIYQDLNGNSKQDEKDLYGFVSGGGTSSDPYWIACKATVLEKDEGNYFIYAADVDRIYETVEDVLALYYRESSFIVSTDSTFDNTIIDMFDEGRAFMATVMITKLEVSLRDFKGEYAILPVPKLDTAQASYRTCVQDQVSAFCLPATLPASDRAMLGAVMECTASESYKTVVDAYYNTALSYKYLNNPESKVMLDLIYDSVSFELAQIYTDIAGNFLTNMRTMVQSKKNTVTSAYKNKEKSMSRAMDKLNIAYEKVVGGA